MYANCNYALAFEYSELLLIEIIFLFVYRKVNKDAVVILDSLNYIKGKSLFTLLKLIHFCLLYSYSVICLVLLELIDPVQEYNTFLSVVLSGIQTSAL